MSIGAVFPPQPPPRGTVSVDSVFVNQARPLHAPVGPVRGEVPILRPEFTTFGLRLDDACRVIAVHAGSPAEARGMQRGDKVIAVDGEQVRDRNSFARVWVKGNPDDYVTLTFERGEAALPPPSASPSAYPPPPAPAPPPPPPAPQPGSMALVPRGPAPELPPHVLVWPRRVFLPVKALRREKRVLNVVTLYNNTKEEMLFAVRSSHSADIAPLPREGILGPAGHSSCTTRVDIAWTPSQQYDFSRPDWGPYDQCYRQLSPSRQPVVAVWCWPRRAGLELTRVDPSACVETKLPVCFQRPSLESDDFHFTVEDPATMESSTYCSDPAQGNPDASALADSVAGGSVIGSEAGYGNPAARDGFLRSVAANERERAEFRRHRQQQPDPQLLLQAPPPSATAHAPPASAGALVPYNAPPPEASQQSGYFPPPPQPSTNSFPPPPQSTLSHNERSYSERWDGGVSGVSDVSGGGWHREAERYHEQQQVPESIQVREGEAARLRLEMARVAEIRESRRMQRPRGDELGPQTGDRVSVAESFKSNNKQQVLLKKGQRGTVQKLGDGGLDGDAFIEFDDHEDWQWVFHENFKNLAAVEVVTIRRRPGEPLGMQTASDMTVTQVMGGGPAEAAGVCGGWRLRAIGGRRTQTPAALSHALDAAGGGELQAVFTHERWGRPDPQKPCVVQ